MSAMIASMSPDDTIYLQQTLQLAAEHMHLGHGGPFGAVIVRGTTVLGLGWNQVTSTPDPTAHAEMVAIRAAAVRVASFQLRGCVLYSSCEPCPMCLCAAYWARIDRIVYAGSREDAAAAGFDDAAFYAELALPPLSRQMPSRQYLREAAVAVFDQWKAMSNKVPY
jgi:guanine deaminase